MQDAIIQGVASNVETISKNQPALALYRRADGTTALHDAIRSRQFEVALILLDKIPSLAMMKDSVTRKEMVRFGLICSISGSTNGLGFVSNDRFDRTK